MALYEYRVIPAPTQGLRDKAVKGEEARFAAAMSALLNAEAADGWEYQRTDTLPAESRDGLMRTRVTVFRNLLVFRRPRTEGPAEPVGLIEDRSDELARPAPVDPTPADATGPAYAVPPMPSVRAPENAPPAVTTGTDRTPPAESADSDPERKDD